MNATGSGGAYLSSSHTANDSCHIAMETHASQRVHEALKGDWRRGTVRIPSFLLQKLGSLS
jgi:hypothetical protein